MFQRNFEFEPTQVDTLDIHNEINGSYGAFKYRQLLIVIDNQLHFATKMSKLLRAQLSRIKPQLKRSVEEKVNFPFLVGFNFYTLHICM